MATFNTPAPVRLLFLRKSVCLAVRKGQNFALTQLLQNSEVPVYRPNKNNNN